MINAHIIFSSNAYLGASYKKIVFPLPMVEKLPLTFTFTIIAREMVRAFMGSIGLVCAIPLPACIAAYLFYDRRNKSERMIPDNYSNVSPVKYFF